MITGESPKILFDIIMTRFEQDYNPTIIYNASCKAKEVGMAREPDRFMNLKIVSDPLHSANHTSCSDSFKSQTYPELHKLNKEAAEQFNSLLRSVQSSVTYMTFDNYMQSLKLFCSFHNWKGLECNNTNQ